MYKEKDKVLKEILDVLTPKLKKTKNRTVKHNADKSGKSTIQEVVLIFKTDDLITVQCYDWSKKMGYSDHLRIGFRTKKFQSFIDNAF